MFKVRHDERLYALLRAVETDTKNIYGNPIDLIEKSGQPRGLSLRINGNETVGDNPDRYKQHGFHFTADNCIGCHACEAACSEKNDLPPYLSFRSVGYIEGGTYPDFTRMNISMACNHCDDPVCLKGCPTRAYTKHPEYGAVLQDPDICFGCGYCTWVCPYNAPQLDPAAGQVQKCNMCVDRLEADLKPACVAACVGNALEFGVIESRPDNRDQAGTTLPGFPDPDITKPNIRFQQQKSMPRELTRTDSAPVKYHRGAAGAYTPVVDRKGKNHPQWGLAELSSRENPLVLFTLVTQAVIGAFLVLCFGPIGASTMAIPYLLCLVVLQAAVLFLSTQHLGKPWRFYRGFNNLRHSPLSREALALTVFFGLLSVMTGIKLIVYVMPAIGNTMLETIFSVLVYPAAAAGLAGIYFMQAIYRIKARPFWDHWQVLTAFYGNVLSVGGVLSGLITMVLLWNDTAAMNRLLSGMSLFISAGLVIEGVGHVFHLRYLRRSGNEAAASYYQLSTRYGKTFTARNSALILCILCTLLFLFIPSSGHWLLTGAWLVISGLVLIMALVSRALFYVVVIPTTMPGAFFWRNKGFEEHARKTGLAKMPQAGVLETDH